MTIHLHGKDITPLNHYLILACADSQRSSPDEVIEVIGDLTLQNCCPLFLPDNLTVGVKGSLYLHGCTSLTRLPDNLTVGGYLNLYGCTSLVKLPDNLTVGGNLILYGCTSLTKLPDNLIVKGGLDLSGCTSLTKLPDNLTVNGSIDLYDCTSLTKLPDNLTVGRDIWVGTGRIEEFKKNNPKFADKIR